MASWKTVEIVGWNPKKGEWVITGVMQDPTPGVYNGKYQYYYVGKASYLTKEADGPQMHAGYIENPSPLYGNWSLFFDPPSGTKLDIDLLEYNIGKDGGRKIVDTATIIIPREKNTCESFKSEFSCKACGCYWYDGACHSSKKVICTDFTNKEECEAMGCYWYDNLCHSIKKKKKTACPIACVCNGTPLIDQLGPIREFRDVILKKSMVGRKFVSFYYGWLGRNMVVILNRSIILKKIGRLVVKSILKKMQR